MLSLGVRMRPSGKPGVGGTSAEKSSSSKIGRGQSITS